MNDQAFDILEFDSLRALIRRNALTAMGAEQMAYIAPLDRVEDLLLSLAHVAEMLEARQKGARFSFDGILNPAEAVFRLKIEGTALDSSTILDLGRLCDRALAARTTILSERDTCPR